MPTSGAAAGRPVSRPRVATRRHHEATGVDASIIRWFDRLDRSVQEIVVQLTISLVRGAVYEGGAYYVERGPMYLAKLCRVSEARASAHHMGILAGMMAQVQGARLDLRRQADRAVVEALLESGLAHRGHQSAWWRLTPCAHAALTTLGLHARRKGFPVPRLRLGPVLRLEVSPRRAGQVRSHCPLHPDAYWSLRLLRSGDAYCFTCFRPVGRWRKSPRGYRFQAYLADGPPPSTAVWSVAEVERAGAPTCYTPDQGGPTGRITSSSTDDWSARVEPRAHSQVMHRHSDERTRVEYAPHPDLLGTLAHMDRASAGPRASRLARRTWDVWQGQADREPGSIWGLASPTVSLDVRAHKAVKSGFEVVGEHYAVTILHPRTLSKVVGTAWIGLSMTGPGKVSDQALIDGSGALEAQIRAEPWSGVLTGRLAAVRAEQGRVSMAVELKSFRSDPRGFLADPAVQAMIADLASLAQRVYRAAGWKCERPEGAPVIAAPGWRVVDGAPYRARLVYLSRERPAWWPDYQARLEAERKRKRERRRVHQTGDRVLARHLNDDSF